MKKTRHLAGIVLKLVLLPVALTHAMDSIQTTGGWVPVPVPVYPPDGSATVCFLATDASGITEGGSSVLPARTTPDYAVFEIGSGGYKFISPFSR